MHFTIEVTSTLPHSQHIYITSSLIAQRYITVYAAQLYTSNDRSKINIVTMISGYGKQFTNLVTDVPDEPAAFVDTLRLVGNEALASYDSNDACTEGLVYALYREVCAQPTEEIRIPDCLMQYGRDACTKEEYAVRFVHLKETLKREERDGVDHWADCGVLDSTAPGA